MTAVWAGLFALCFGPADICLVQVIRGAEAYGFAHASGIVTLSATDVDFAQQAGDSAHGKRVAFLAPGIRQDMAAIPPLDLMQPTTAEVLQHESGRFLPAATEHAQKRPYLTCAVRLSPEKEPEVFVDIAAYLHRSGALQRHQLTPLLLASATTPYAERLRQRFQSEVPTGVVERAFLGPEALARVYAATRLNVHPCQYDAYGMTVIEAASQGAPSIVHLVRLGSMAMRWTCSVQAAMVHVADSWVAVRFGSLRSRTSMPGCAVQGDGVGATHTLQPPQGRAFAVDLAQPLGEVAAAIERILDDDEELVQRGSRALLTARAYNGQSNAERLLQLIDDMT
jgi:glycosyltransferase involved in cell wall biosynthesis